MGNGVKGLLVALFILSVVVVAKLVHKDSEGEEKPDSKGASAAGQKPLASTNPTTRAPAGPSSARPPTGTPPAGGARLTPGGSVVGTRPIDRTAATAGANGGVSMSPVLPPGATTSAETSGGAALAASPPSPGASGATATRSPTTSAAAPAATNTAGASPAPGAKSEGLIALATPNVPAASDGFLPQPAPGASSASAPRTSANIASPPSPAESSTAAASPGGFKSTESSLGQIPRPSGMRSTEPGGPFNAPLGGGASSAAAAPSPVVSSTPRAAATVALPAVHEVKPNDNYWKLAETYYGLGMGKHFKVIEKANNKVNLVPGRKVQIPALPAAITAAKAEAAAPAAAREKETAPPAPPRRTPDGKFLIHVVQKGDTLSAIAKRYLNSTAGVSAIKDANSFLHYSVLEEGQKLKIPVAAK